MDMLSAKLKGPRAGVLREGEVNSVPPASGSNVGHNYCCSQCTVIN